MNIVEMANYAKLLFPGVICFDVVLFFAYKF
jgi:hypothetical protein